MQPAHEQQRRHVPTGDQQHQCRGAEEREQYPAGVLIEVLASTLNLWRHPVEVGIRFGLSRRHDSSSARASSMVTPSRSRPTRSQIGAFNRSGFGASGAQKST